MKKAIDKEFQNFFEELIEKIKIPEFKENRNYWVVRAGVDSECYDDFLIGGYVAVGLKDIRTIEEIKNSTSETLKDNIEKLYPNKKSPGSSASMLKNFVESINIGDIIITPSAGKKRVSFGIVTGEPYIDENDSLRNRKEDLENDFLNKKRKVRWMTTLDKSDVEPKLLLAISSPNSVFSINKKIIDLIDSHFSMFHKNGENGNLTFEIQKESDLGIDLVKFQSNLVSVLELYQEITGESLDLDKIIFKVRAQSKGRITISGKVLTIALLGALTVGVVGGNFNCFGVNFKTEGLCKYFLEKQKEENKLKLRELEIKLKEIELEKERLQIKSPIIEQN
ncbi:MAG: hypothetical protein ACRCXY_00905 [Fusobacteriaceae bacterium]